MRSYRPWLVLTMLIAVATSACGTSAPSPSASPPPLPVATSFEGYAVSFCAAFESMFLAVGNPDTASGSVLSKALDDAVTAGDGVAADRLAGEITAELESGRQHVRSAGGWSPAAPAMTQLDRVFVAFEAMTAAKAARARGESSAIEPQAAFEGAGGVEAWFSMLEAYRAIDSQRPAEVQPCDVPISP